MGDKGTVLLSYFESIKIQNKTEEPSPCLPFLFFFQNSKCRYIGNSCIIFCNKEGFTTKMYNNVCIDIITTQKQGNEVILT